MRYTWLNKVGEGAVWQKTATLNVRIEPEVKEAAVKIFDEWGISTSSAINMMLKNIVRSKDAHPDMLFLAGMD